MKTTQSLKGNYAFRRLYTKGKSSVQPAVVLYCRKNGARTNRLGLTVGTKVGKAVVRNRVRRRLREICRLHASELRPGTDMIVVARGRSVNAAYRELERDYLAACRKLSLLKEAER